MAAELGGVVEALGHHRDGRSTDAAGNRKAMPDADFATWPKPEDIEDSGLWE